MKALSYESPSYFMLRNLFDNKIVKSDLFTLGSALYKLEHRSSLLIDVTKEEVIEFFK